MPFTDLYIMTLSLNEMRCSIGSQCRACRSGVTCYLLVSGVSYVIVLAYCCCMASPSQNIKPNTNMNRSCLTNICWQLCKHGLDCCIKASKWITVCLDYKKAFDSVPLKSLLVKLKLHGVHGKLYISINSYLTSWKVFVNDRL